MASVLMQPVLCSCRPGSIAAKLAELNNVKNILGEIEE